VVELLGIGVPDERGGWLLHRVCARFEHGELTAVVVDGLLVFDGPAMAFDDDVVGRRLRGMVG
jgi:hypothetical protein